VAGAGAAELKQHHAARQAVHELNKFARSEADAIMAKITNQVNTKMIVILINEEFFNN
jgi:hypothetical protein